MRHLHVELVAADRKVWEGEAREVIARTIEGELGILPGHTPLLGILVEGDVRIQSASGQEHTATIDGGFLSVEHDRVTIVAEAVDASSDPRLTRSVRQLLFSSEMLVGVCVLAVVLYLAWTFARRRLIGPRRAADPLRHPGRRPAVVLAVRSGPLRLRPGRVVPPRRPAGPSRRAGGSAPGSTIGAPHPLDPREKPTALHQGGPSGSAAATSVERFDLAHGARPLHRAAVLARGVARPGATSTSPSRPAPPWLVGSRAALVPGRPPLGCGARPPPGSHSTSPPISGLAHPAEDEQQVRQPVEVLRRQRVDVRRPSLVAVPLERGPGATARPAGRPCGPRAGSAAPGRAAGQDERAQLLAARSLYASQAASSSSTYGVGDPQRRVLGVARRPACTGRRRRRTGRSAPGAAGARRPSGERRRRRAPRRCARWPRRRRRRRPAAGRSCCVRLMSPSVRRAVVAGPGVDAGEVDHAAEPRCAPAGSRGAATQGVRRGCGSGHRRRPLTGEVRGRRREEQRAQADGGRAARRGRTTLDQRPGHPRRRRSWPSCCGGSAARSTTTADRPASVDDRRPGAARPPGRLRPGPRACAPRSACSARWSPAAASADVALPGGDAIGSRGLDMHVAGPGAARRDVVHVEHGFLVAEAPDGLTGGARLARLPERRAPPRTC